MSWPADGRTLRRARHPLAFTRAVRNSVHPAQQRTQRPDIGPRDQADREGRTRSGCAMAQDFGVPSRQPPDAKKVTNEERTCRNAAPPAAQSGRPQVVNTGPSQASTAGLVTGAEREGASGDAQLGPGKHQNVRSFMPGEARPRAELLETASSSRRCRRAPSSANSMNHEEALRAIEGLWSQRVTIIRTHRSSSNMATSTSRTPQLSRNMALDAQHVDLQAVSARGASATSSAGSTGRSMVPTGVAFEGQCAQFGDEHTGHRSRRRRAAIRARSHARPRRDARRPP